MADKCAVIEISIMRQSFARLESFGGVEEVVKFSKKQVAGNCCMFGYRSPGVQQHVTSRNGFKEPTE